MTKTGRSAAVFGALVFGTLIVAALVAGNADAAMVTDKYGQCLKRVNEICKSHYNPLDDAEGFVKCLEEKNKELKCDDKTKGEDL